MLRIYNQLHRNIYLWHKFTGHAYGFTDSHPAEVFIFNSRLINIR